MSDKHDSSTSEEKHKEGRNQTVWSLTKYKFLDPFSKEIYEEFRQNNGHQSRIGRNIVIKIITNLVFLLIVQFSHLINNKCEEYIFI